MPNMKTHMPIIHDMYTIWKIIKDDAPEWLADMMMLFLPRLGDAPGKCSLCPEGLANPPRKKLKPDNIQLMLLPMKGAAVLSEAVKVKAYAERGPWTYFAT